jgi:hypothetical protein
MKIKTNYNDMVCSICGSIHEKDNEIGLYNCTYCAGLDTDKYIILSIDIVCNGYCESCILSGSCKNQEKANQYNYIAERDEADYEASLAGYDSGLFDYDDDFILNLIYEVDLLLEDEEA